MSLRQRPSHTAQPAYSPASGADLTFATLPATHS